MPNIKSAIKRVKTSSRKEAENKLHRSELATAIKKYKKAVEEKKFDGIDALYSNTVALIDSACSKKIIKKNHADRNKSRLASLLDAARKTK